MAGGSSSSVTGINPLTPGGGGAGSGVGLVGSIDSSGAVLNLSTGGLNSVSGTTLIHSPGLSGATGGAGSGSLTVNGGTLLTTGGSSVGSIGTAGGVIIRNGALNLSSGTIFTANGGNLLINGAGLGSGPLAKANLLVAPGQTVTLSSGTFVSPTTTAMTITVNGGPVDLSAGGSIELNPDGTAASVTLPNGGKIVFGPGVVVSAGANGTVVFTFAGSQATLTVTPPAGFVLPGAGGGATDGATATVR